MQTYNTVRAKNKSDACYFLPTSPPFFLLIIQVKQAKSYSITAHPIFYFQFVMEASWCKVVSRVFCSKSL